MDKTITVDQKCLVNNLVLSFRALKKCAIAQSNLMILSKVIAVTETTTTDRQTPSSNPLFLTRGVSKRGAFMKTGGGQI